MIKKIEDIIQLILDNKGMKLEEKVTKETHLRDGLGLDSLDLAELTVRIENEFGVDVFDDGIVNTVGEIINKLQSNNVK